MPRVVMLETIKAYATEQLDAQPEFAAAARESHARLLRGRSRTDADDRDRSPPSSTTSGSPGATRSPDRISTRLNELRDALWPIYEARGWYHATIQLADDLLAVRRSSPDRPDAGRRSDAADEPRPGDDAPARLHRRSRGRLRRGTGPRQGARRGAAALPGPSQPRQLPRLPRRVRQGDRTTRRDPPTRRRARTTRACASTGYTLLGANTGFTGHLETGLGYLDQAIAAFEGGGYQPRRLRLGLDPRVSCLTTSGFFLWFLGHPDRAVGRADRAIALATDLDHPYSLAYAFYHAGFLHLWRREPEVVADRAASALRVAETSDLPIWRALANVPAGRRDERAAAGPRRASARSPTA